MVAIGFALRFYKFDYGITGSYVADTQTVSEAMDIGNSLVKADFGVFLKPVKYPFIVPYLILFLHGTIFLVGRVLGAFHTVADFFKFIALNQGFSFLVARFISIVAGILTIVFAFFSSKILAGRFKSPKPYLAAAITSVFVSFSLLLFQFSRLERPHIIAGFFILLSYFFYLRFLEKPTWKNGVWVGIGIGLAAGSLQNGILAGVFLVIPLVLYFFRKIKSYTAILGGFLSAAILIFLSYPFLILSFRKALGLSQGKFDISLSGATHNVFPFGGQGFYKIFHHLIVYEPAIFILIVIGVIVVIFKSRLREFFKADSGGLACFAALFFIVFGFYNFTLPRYIIPLVILAAVVAGPLAVEIFSLKTETNVKKKFQITGWILLIILAAFSLAQVLRLTYLLRHPDTRDLASDWLKNNTKTSDFILESANVVSLPPTKESILINKKLGGTTGRRDELMLSLTEAEYPSNARAILREWELNIGDYSKFISKNNVKYVVLTDENGFHDFKESLFIFAQKNLKLKESFSPFIIGHSNLSSPFPGDFHNPLRELWGIKQMGPEVRIYSRY